MADELFSFELFFMIHDSSQHIYPFVIKIIERHYLQNKLLSLEKVKQLTVEITGVFPITDDMCIKFCIVYTSSYQSHKECPVCGECCFDSQQQPRWVFATITPGWQCAQAVHLGLWGAILLTPSKSLAFRSTEHPPVLSYGISSYQDRPTYHLISMDDRADNWQSDSRIAAAI